ncbi:hypothetical protein HELRODRAFT_72745 [Helobdella robusta]|uniref:Calponin-homology (CH) domain-containing protein n=1 Tax=Helobdella robusta TaxID=6412 RepID=T1G147_HELRO|nr:hypothetical protein HELRODRAFT_72745 [Helobdella robusta]ESO10099.1 hypothetical protein HELRODRAFT_72745 [Helobdella robusta]
MSVRRHSQDILGEVQTPGDAAERDLAGDAQWKLIQKNTFTRWTNEHLKTVNKHVVDLETDLSDGLRFIALVEVLSGKRFTKFNKRPTMRSHKLENVTLALEFLQKEEGIKIVNIDSSAIVDGKLKLILGLIWTLILHYSISMPMWEEEGDKAKKTEQTPKQRLLGWVLGKVTDVPVTNFTTDWNDGKAIGALVDGVAPGLCPDWDSWNPKDNVSNATEAMNAAEQWLDVPQLIKPAEMCNPKVDELSMMTYLSQFPNAKLKPGAPLRPKTNPARVRAYGPGLDAAGNSVGAPARFTVETFSAGRGELDIAVTNPNGVKEQCEVIFNKDRNLTYSCHYTPTMEGQYSVVIKFANREIPKSPFMTKVEGMAGDPTKVTASGPGLEKTGVMVKKPTYFEVHTKNAGTGVVDVVIVDSHGHKDSTKAVITKKSNDLWFIEYNPVEDGLHTVNILFAGKPIPTSPFAVAISPAVDAKKCFITGRGVQPNGLRIGDVADFKVHTAGAGDGELKVQITGPGGAEEKPKIKKVDATTYECSYEPHRTGEYTINVTYGGDHVFKSPFMVDVAPQRPTKIKAYGPGLHGGVAGYPASFTVETNDETGGLGFSIEGPSQAKINCSDNHDGSALISYTPTEPGEYAIHILCDEEDIHMSPWMAIIKPKPSDSFDPSKVKAYGPGLKSSAAVNEPVEFVVDAKGAGNGKLFVEVLDDELKPVDTLVKDNKDGTYAVKFIPKKAVKHVVVATFGDVPINEFPYRISVHEPSNPNKVKVYGNALNVPAKVGEPTEFSIDCSKAGPGDVGIILLDDKGKEVPFQIKDEPNNCFNVTFTPTHDGVHKAHVHFADQELPTSPFKIPVESSINPQKVKVNGDGIKPTGVLASLPVQFVVDASEAGPADIDVVIQDPDGHIVRPEIKKTATPGVYNVTYTPESVGEYVIPVKFNKEPVPNSPFKVKSLPVGNADKVKFVDEVQPVVAVGQPSTINLDPSKAGDGQVTCRINSLSDDDVDIDILDNGDGTMSIVYTPTKPGDYALEIKFGGKPVPDGKFVQKVFKEFDPADGRERWKKVDKSTWEENDVQHYEWSSRDRKPQEVNFIEASEPLLSIKGDDGGPKIDERLSSIIGDDKRLVLTSNKVQSSPLITWSGLDVVSMKDDVTASPNDGKRRETTTRLEGSKQVHSEESVWMVTPKSHHIHIQQPPYDNYSLTSRFPQKLFIGDKNALPCKATYKVLNSGMADTFPLRSVLKVEDSNCIRQSDRRSNRRNLNKSRRLQKIFGRTRGNFTYYIVCMNVFVSDNSFFRACSIPFNFASMFKSARANKCARCVVTYIHTRARMYFNYLQDELSASKSRPLGSKRGPTGADDEYKPVEFSLPVGPVFSFVTAEIETPSGRKEKPTVVDNHDGTVGVVYTPSEEGLHKLFVLYNDKPINGSPFEFYVSSEHSGLVYAYGPGLSHGVSGEMCNFTIVTKDAGAGGLSLAVEGPSKADMQCSDNGDGTCSVSYLPTAPGDYKVNVSFDNKHIQGSPFTAKISPSDARKSHAALGGSSDVPLKLMETDLSSLKSTIKYPSGKVEPCTIKRLDDGQLGIGFTPTEVGDHYVEVLKHGKHVPNSPFKITVNESEIANASRVKAYGKGLQEGNANEVNEFFVETKNAGFGGLSLSVEGPSKADMECMEESDGVCVVKYKPTEPGSYVIHVKFADQHIPGSPFLVKIGGQPGGVKSDEFFKNRGPGDVTHVGSECELALKIPGLFSMFLEASVTSPSGKTERCDVEEVGNDQFSIKFVPKELGAHTVGVKHKGMHLPGHPFQFTVGPIKEGGAHKVKAIGSGLERAQVDVPAHFNVHTREAGPGCLSVGMEGPSKAFIDFKDASDGSCLVSYTCDTPGDYQIFMKYNDQNIPDSPFKVYVAPSGSDKRLNIGDLQEKGCQLNRPAVFTVDMTGSKGSLDARIIAPSGAEDQAIVEQIDKNSCTVRFVPHENGVHQIFVRQNGFPIAGSPFKVVVGNVEADPSMVRVYGDGLTKGQTGLQPKFVVDTTKAGSGALAVTVDGPSKVQLNCIEVSNGYEFTYFPSAPGEYLISVKYGGASHVPGSPYKAVVTGSGRPGTWNEQTKVVVETVTKSTTTQMYSAQDSRFDSDASKVNSKGMGLQKASANKEATFTVDASRAGHNMLLVGVMGPELPCEEVSIRYSGDGQYTVIYRPGERGEYVLVVKWGEQHIPGSPFKIVVQ